MVMQVVRSGLQVDIKYASDMHIESNIIALNTWLNLHADYLHHHWDFGIRMCRRSGYSTSPKSAGERFSTKSWNSSSECWRSISSTAAKSGRVAVFITSSVA